MDKGLKLLLHAYGRTAAMHISGKGKELLLGYHLDRFFSGYACCLFQIKFLRNGDHKDIIGFAFSHGYQSLENLSLVLAQEPCDLHSVC